VARDGVFIPSGNNNRSHHDTALLDAGLRKRSAGSRAVVMLERRGHYNKTVVTLHVAGVMPSTNFFVPVKIA
jgi:hypothetical protein